MTDPHAELKQQVRELIARLDPQPNCPATHPLGPCFGQVGHGAIHWIWVPDERKGEHGHMRLIWTEDNEEDGALDQGACSIESPYLIPESDTDKPA